MRPVSQLETNPYVFILGGLKFARQLGLGTMLMTHSQSEAELKRCITCDGELK